VTQRAEGFGWPVWSEVGRRNSRMIDRWPGHNFSVAARSLLTRLLFFSEFCGGPVARAIDPGQSVKPCDKKGVAPWRRGCFFGVVTPNPHARQNSPPWLKSNLQT
jgi:hypothetical protein